LTGASRKAGFSRLPELRTLPRSVAWFYARALTVALRRGGGGNAAPLPPAGELAEALELARGCDRVLVCGPACSLTASALALDDARRRVLAFREQGWNEPDPYVSLLPGTTRSRVDLVGGPVAHLPARAPLRVCMLLLEGEDVADLPALVQLVDIVQPGGRIALREDTHPGQGWVKQALLELGLEPEPHGGGARLVWRKPVERPSEAVPPPRRRWRRRVLVALAVAALAAGLAAAAVTLVGDSDDPARGTPAPAVERSKGSLRGVDPSNVTPGTRSGRPADSSQKSRSSGGGAGRAPRPSSDGGARQSFSGQGAVQLGTLVVRSPSLLIWTSTAGGLSIASDSLVLNSPASRGTTQLSPRSYAHFTVKSPGTWTIRIRPR
jgi:hypothetical protein